MRIFGPCRFCRIALYLLGITLLTACDQKPAGGNPLVSLKDARVVAVGWAADDLQWPGIRGGIARAAAEFRPLSVEFRAASDTTPATYAALIADVEQRKPHAVILQIGRESDVHYAVRRLVRAGIRVVTIGKHIRSEGEYGRVEIDLAQAAELLGQTLPRIAGEGRAYVLLHARGADEESTRLYQRFSAGAEKNRVFQRLAERCTFDSKQSPRELIGEMLSEFKNVSLVVTLDAEPWRSDAAGLLGPGNRFVTLPASPALWGEIRAGRCAALAGPLDGDSGAAALKLVVHALSNSPRPGLPTVIPCELVTPETLDDFSRRYRVASGLDAAP